MVGTYLYFHNDVCGWLECSCTKLCVAWFVCPLHSICVVLWSLKVFESVVGCSKIATFVMAYYSISSFHLIYLRLWVCGFVSVVVLARLCFDNDKCCHSVLMIFCIVFLCLWLQPFCSIIFLTICMLTCLSWCHVASVNCFILFNIGSVPFVCNSTHYKYTWSVKEVQRFVKQLYWPNNIMKTKELTKHG